MHEAKHQWKICYMLFYTNFSQKGWFELLNLVLKTGDRIQIGDNVIIKLQSDSRAQLAIDAPRQVEIKRIAPDGVGKSTSDISEAGKRKNIVVVNNRPKQ